MKPLFRLFLVVGSRLLLFFAVTTWLTSQWWEFTASIPVGASVEFDIHPRGWLCSCSSVPMSWHMKVHRIDGNTTSWWMFLDEIEEPSATDTFHINVAGIMVLRNPIASVISIRHGTVVSLSALVFVLVWWYDRRMKRASADNV